MNLYCTYRIDRFVCDPIYIKIIIRSFTNLNMRCHFTARHIISSMRHEGRLWLKPKYTSYYSKIVNNKCTLQMQQIMRLHSTGSENISPNLPSGTTEQQKTKLDDLNDSSKTADWEPPSWLFSIGYFARPVPVLNGKGFTMDYFARFLAATPAKITSPFKFSTDGGGKYADSPNWVKLMYLGLMLLLVGATSLVYIKEYIKDFKAAATNTERIEPKKKKEGI